MESIYLSIYLITFPCVRIHWVHLQESDQYMHCEVAPQSSQPADIYNLNGGVSEAEDWQNPSLWRHNLILMTSHFNSMTSDNKLQIKLTWRFMLLWSEKGQHARATESSHAAENCSVFSVHYFVKTTKKTFLFDQFFWLHFALGYVNCDVVPGVINHAWQSTGITDINIHRNIQ